MPDSDHDKPTRCALCDSPAVAIYYMSRGCVAYPDLTVQPLCGQHEAKATPLGRMELIKELCHGQEPVQAQAQAQARA